jgi:hypothetical protein
LWELDEELVDAHPGSLPLFFILLCEWASLVISANQCQGKHLIRWFPGVVGIWVPLPFDEVLQGLALPIQPVIDDGLYFILCFAFDQLRQWSDEVWAELGRFMISGKEGGMEYIMDGPGAGELELIGDR